MSDSDWDADDLLDDMEGMLMGEMSANEPFPWQIVVCILSKLAENNNLLYV